MMIPLLAPTTSATGEAAGWLTRPRIDPVWAVCSVLAAFAVIASAFRPLWELELRAPQYPAGLSLIAYGTKMAGDLSEINSLNHYVGIGTLHPDMIWELDLFPFAIAGVVAIVLIGAVFARSPWLRGFVMLTLWGLPAGLLVDLQWWLYRYGHDLSHDAPIRLDPFTPRVLGPTRVVNFQSESMVQDGFWLMLAAALLVTFGPSVVRFVRDAWNNTGTPAAVAALILVLLGGTSLATPRFAGAEATHGAIAAAIAAATPGATVTIPAGVYRGALIIDRPVVLVGEGAIIDGDGQGDVVQITAKDVTLRGFVIRHSARQVTGEPAGIRVTADRATIEDNRVQDVLYGIVLDESGGHTVRRNHVSSILDFAAERRGHALYLWYSDQNLLSENTLTHAKDGIFLGFATHTTVERNHVTQVRYGLHTMYAHNLVLRDNIFRNNLAGGSLMYSRGLTVTNNEFSENRSEASGYGLLFKDLDDVELSGNRIHHNRLGLTMDGAPHTPGAYVTLRGNLVAFNGIAMELFTTTSITATENTFIGNLQQVESRGGSLEHSNRWSADGRGNYWDDYQGYDASGDGVGDLRYVYTGAFDDLVQHNEAVRAYSFTIARIALDQAARWFPIFPPEPRVVDERPLMAPTMRLAAAPLDRVEALIPVAMQLSLVTAALGVFALGMRSFGKK